MLRRWCPKYKACKERENESEIVVSDSLKDLNVEDWNAVVPKDNYFIHSEFLSVIEKTHKDKLEFRYAIVYKNNKPIVASYFQIVDFSGQELANYIPTNNWNGFLYKINNKFQRFVDCTLRNVNWKLLVTGNLFLTGENGVYHTDDLTDAQSYGYLNEIANYINDNCKKDRKVSAFLMPDFYKEASDNTTILKENKYRHFKTEADMRLKVNPKWLSFEDYTAAFSSKYRVRAKKVMKTSKELVVRELHADDIVKNIEHIYNLYMNVAGKVKFNMAYLTREYFVKLKEEMGSDFKIMGYYLPGQIDGAENKLIGFISYFVHKDLLDVHFVGLNYNYNKEYSLYQRILYDSVALGIKERVPLINFGRTAPEIKSTIGAVPHPMYSYIKHTSMVSNIILKPLATYLKPADWVQRKPFKEAY